MIAKLLFVAISSLIITIVLYKKQFKTYQIIFLLLTFLLPYNITGSILHFPQLRGYYPQLHIHFFQHKIISNYLIPYISILDVLAFLNLTLFLFERRIKLIIRLSTLTVVLFLIGLNFLKVDLVSAITIYRWTIYPLSLSYTTFKIFKDWLKFLKTGDLKTRENLINLSFTTVAITIINLIVEIIISTYQVLTKHSLGIYFLGESHIKIGQGGYISKAIILDHLVLRGYGTFPHPNVLANYALFIIIVGLIIKKHLQYKEILWQFYGKSATAKLNRVLDITIILSIISLLLTFSRIPGFLGILTFLYYLYLYKLKPQWKRPFLYFSFGFFFCASLFIYFGTNWQSSFANRYALNLLAINIIQFSFPRGLGPGQFVSAFDTFHIISNGQSFIQPVHNIYLLLISEIGIWGFFLSLGLLGMILVITITTIRYKQYQTLPLAFYVLIETNIDHLFLTQPQGIIFFSVTLIIMILYLSYLKLGGSVYTRPSNINRNATRI